MRIIERTSQFKRDIERMGKRGKDMRKFKEVLQTLVEGKQLAPQYRDHPLLGQYTALASAISNPTGYSCTKRLMKR